MGTGHTTIHDHDPIDFTFADDGDLVRRERTDSDDADRQNARAARAPRKSTSKVAKRVPSLVEVKREVGKVETTVTVKREADTPGAIEIRHGSGKVKV